MLLGAFRPQTTTEVKKVTNSEHSRGICSSFHQCQRLHLLVGELLLKNQELRCEVGRLRGVHGDSKDVV
jgi:hypothetical protein